MVTPKYMEDNYNISSENLCTAKCYKKYYKKATPNKHDAMFNHTAWLDDKLLREFCHNVILYIKEYKCVSQSEIARQVGVTPQYICTSNYRLDVAKKILKYLLNKCKPTVYDAAEYYNYSTIRLKELEEEK